MSKDCDILVHLNTEANFDSIKKILDRGTEIGLTYLQLACDNKGDAFDGRYTIVSAEVASQQVLTGLISRRKDDFDGVTSSLTATGFGIFFYIGFSKQEKHLRILFSNAGAYWQKQKVGYPYNSGFMDFERYIRILLTLCQDFSLIHLHAYDSDFEQAFTKIARDTNRLHRPYAIRTILIELIGKPLSMEACIGAIIQRGTELRLNYIEQDQPTEASYTLTAKLKNTQILIKFYKTTQGLKVFLHPLEPYKYKDGFLDFREYIEFLLYLTTDFIIIDMQTYSGDSSSN